MTTTFPTTIDSYTTKVDGVTPAVAANINDVQDAVVAIETELGTLAKGSYTNVKDRIEAIDTDDWASWSGTITVTQGVAVTATVVEAKYRKLGRLAEAYFRLNITSAGTGGSAVVITGIPAAIQNQSKPMGVGMIIDAAGGIYVGVWFSTGLDDWRMYVHQVGSTSVVGSVPNFALASGDIVYANLHWYM